MKVAIYYHLPFGGAQRALANYLAGLLKTEHEVISFGPPQFDRDEVAALGIKHETISPQIEVVAEGSSYLSRAVGQIRRERDLVAQAWGAGKTAAEAIAKGEFDVVIASSSLFLAPPSVAIELRKLGSKIPSLLYLQEPTRLVFEAGSEGQRWISPKFANGPRSIPSRIRAALDFGSQRNWGALETESIRAYDRVLVNSYFSRESVLKAYGVDAKVCYLGVNAHRFQPRERREEDAAAPYVVSIGSLAPSKNTHLVIQALADLKTRFGMAVGIRWVANFAYDDYAQQMHDLASRLGVAFHVDHLPSDEELANILSGCEAVVYAPQLEPFGFVPIEANLCEIPVVAVAEGGCRETVIDGVTGLLAENTPESLSERLHQLLTNPELRERLVAKGREIALTKWSLEEANARFQAHVHDLVQPATVR